LVWLPPVARLTTLRLSDSVRFRPTPRRSMFWAVTRIWTGGPMVER
jgi:hypothetical protein